MLKLLQIIRFYKSQGYNLSQVVEVICEMVDNRISHDFVLTDMDYNRIEKVFNDDQKFESVLRIEFN